MPIKKDADMGSGAGLGISICKQLVGLMKGALPPTELGLGLGLRLGLALGLGLGLAYPYPESPPPLTQASSRCARASARGPR